MFEIIKSTFCGLVIAALILILAALMGCVTEPLMVGSSRESVEYFMARDPVEVGDRLYWCEEGLYGYTQVIMARFENGRLAEYPQSRTFVTGTCEQAVREWSNRLKLADKMGIKERW